MTESEIQIQEYLKKLIESGNIDPNCRYCKENFIPRIESGIPFTDIFTPRHKASERCRSGKHPHCTCDTCF